MDTESVELEDAPEVQYTQCECCGEPFPDEEMREMEVRPTEWERAVPALYCEGCADEAIVCVDCGCVSAHLHETVNGEAVCSVCCDRSYQLIDLADCYSGGLWAPDWECNWVGDLDGYVTERYAHNYCYWSESNDCYMTEPDDEPGILRYTARAPYELGFDTHALGKALAFGVELEFECADNGTLKNALEAINAEYGRGRNFIVKSDGSLDIGAEVCTLPATLDQHATGKASAPDWHAISRGLLSAGAYSGKGTSNCGIHVHVNRRAVTPLTLGKLLVFVNSDKMRPQLETIAQRRRNKFAYAQPKKIADGLCDESADRYEVLNVCERTIEFRIFRGNLRAERILKNIEFCHAAVTYCKTCSVNAAEDWDAFARHVMRARKTYPNLSAFMRERGLATS